MSGPPKTPVYGVDVTCDLMAVLPEIMGHVAGSRLLVDRHFMAVGRFGDLSNKPKVRLSNGIGLYKVIDGDDDNAI
jgi:hypothetical protein